MPGGTSAGGASGGLPGGISGSPARAGLLLFTGMIYSLVSIDIKEALIDSQNPDIQVWQCL